MATGEEPAAAPRFGVLRTIAVYKLVKVSLLLLVAYGELRLHDASLSAKLLSWARGPPVGTRTRRGEPRAARGSAA